MQIFIIILRKNLSETVKEIMLDIRVGIFVDGDSSRCMRTINRDVPETMPLFNITADCVRNRIIFSASSIRNS